jgi:TRAP-type transport system periplasmic protein
MAFMRRSRRRFVGALSAIGVPIVCPRLAAADQYTMRLGTAVVASSPLGQAGVRFASAVARRTSGQLKIEVYPNGQLGQQQETVDGLTTGVIDFALTSTSFLQQMFPRFQLFDMPFLCKDLNAAYRLIDGRIGTELFGELESRGIIAYGWAINGSRQIETTTKTVIVPEDMKGVRIRIQPTAVFVAVYQALGAIPLSVDLAEVPAALSQHTLDGVDFAIGAFTTQQLYASCKHVAMSNHGISPQVLLASRRKIEALPQRFQKVLKEEGRGVVPSWRSAIVREEAASLQLLKQKEVVFSEIQYAPFRKAVEPVYVTMQSKIGSDLIERASH